MGEVVQFRQHPPKAPDLNGHLGQVESGASITLSRIEETLSPKFSYEAKFIAYELEQIPENKAALDKIKAELLKVIRTFMPEAIQIKTLPMTKIKADDQPGDKSNTYSVWVVGKDSLTYEIEIGQNRIEELNIPQTSKDYLMLRMSIRHMIDPKNSNKTETLDFVEHKLRIELDNLARDLFNSLMNPDDNDDGGSGNRLTIPPQEEKIAA